MPSKAKTTKENLVKYKVIQKDEFAYSAMQVGRDETVRVVLYTLMNLQLFHQHTTSLK